MARIRTHKPEFWTSEQVAECSIEARLLFLGLMNFCDDGGRMQYSAKRIKGQIFPFDDFSSSDIRRWIDELSSSEFGDPMVITYDVGGKQYLELTGFNKHQKIDRPTYQCPNRNGVIPESKGFSNSLARRALDDGSTPEWKGREGNGRESKGKERKGGTLTRTTRARDAPRSDHDWPDDYRTQFADAYPHKVGMTAALDALDEARGKISWCVVMSAVASYADTKPPDRQWANPKTWIEQERWNDRPATPPIAGNGRTHVTDADIAAELAREAGERRRSAQAAGDEAQRGGSLPAGGGDAELPGASGRRTG